MYFKHNFFVFLKMSFLYINNIPITQLFTHLVLIYDEYIINSIYPISCTHDKDVVNLPYTVIY